jgi:hypothetical protein
MRKMRRISGSFWTPERDERLRYLEAEGFSAAKIAERLGTSRGAVLGRLHRLSGATLTYPSYIRQEKEARARAAARTKERTRVESTVISRLQQEIARGVGRDRAIARARKAGATLRAIGDAVGIRKSGCDRFLYASCERTEPGDTPVETGPRLRCDALHDQCIATHLPIKDAYPLENIYQALYFIRGNSARLLKEFDLTKELIASCNIRLISMR